MASTCNDPRGRKRVLFFDESGQPRMSSTLGAFLDAYLGSRDDIKLGSKLVCGHTRRCLIEFFGGGKPLRSITEDDAQQWRRYLTAQGLSEATVCKRCQNARAFVNVVVKKKLIPAPPSPNWIQVRRPMPASNSS